MSGPICPNDVKEIKPVIIIPQRVFDAVNKLIKNNIKDGVSKVYREHVISELHGVNGAQLKAIPDSYREVGWKVTFFNKPPYNEPAYYIFEKPDRLKIESQKYVDELDDAHFSIFPVLNI